MNSIQIKELLHERSLKATKTRINVLNKMHKHGSAMSHSAIQKEMKKTDRVTLYRTLEALKEKGVIHKAFQDNNDIYYAICDNNCDAEKHHDEHLHFKCVKCNSITCEEMSEAVEISIPNFVINKVSVNVEGLCLKCV